MPSVKFDRLPADHCHEVAFVLSMGDYRCAICNEMFTEREVRRGRRPYLVRHAPAASVESLRARLELQATLLGI